MVYENFIPVFFSGFFFFFFFPCSKREPKKNDHLINTTNPQCQAKRWTFRQFHTFVLTNFLSTADDNSNYGNSSCTVPCPCLKVPRKSFACQETIGPKFLWVPVTDVKLITERKKIEFSSPHSSALFSDFSDFCQKTWKPNSDLLGCSDLYSVKAFVILTGAGGWLLRNQRRETENPRHFWVTWIIPMITHDCIHCTSFLRSTLHNLDFLPQNNQLKKTWREFSDFVHTQTLTASVSDKNRLIATCEPSKIC